MAAKEPTVELKFGERPCDVDAIALVSSFKAKGEGELYTSDIQLIAAALRAAAERAWDEGLVYALDYVSVSHPELHDANPYRLPKGPTK